MDVDVVAGVHADRVPEPLQQGASEDEACSVFELGRVSLPGRWRVPSPQLVFTDGNSQEETFTDGHIDG
jgi:hypothetical protein